MRYLPFTIANNFKYGYVTHCTADFETCFCDDTRQDVRVWAFGLYDYISGDYQQGNNIDDFLKKILLDSQVYDIAFHNLKFDGSFILPALYRLGYEYIPNRKFMEMWKNDQDVSNYFTHNITNMGQWFSVTIGKKRMATPRTPAFVHIWDSLKLFPQTLKEIGLQYNKDFKKLDFSKEDYERIRPAGYDPLPYEWEYLKADCLTLGEALKNQLSIYGKLYRTRASKAFSFFKESCTAANDPDYNLYSLKYEGVQKKIVPYIEELADYEGKEFRFLPRTVKDYIRAKKIKMDVQTDWYIPSYKVWLDLKKAYRGGISYVNPFYKEKSINEPLASLDRNSMYPSEMYEKPIPYGAFEKVNGKPDIDKYAVWIACARVSFKLKKPEYLPCIQLKGVYGREWLAESTDFKEWNEESKWNEDILFFSSVDFETFQNTYHFTVHEWIYYYGFKNADNGDGYRFITQCYAEKEEAGQKRGEIEKRLVNFEIFSQDDDWIRYNNQYAEAKVKMNSAYGKHGTKYNLLSKRTDWIDECVVYTGEQENFNKEPDEPSHYYIPYAVFVTSYARQSLVTTWNAFVDAGAHPVYCDTDSIHYIGNDDTVPESLHHAIDWEKTGALGLWKVEGHYTHGRYLRSKAYMEIEENGDVKAVCAGATPAIKKVMTWENFHVGFDAWEIIEKTGRKKGLSADEIQTLKNEHCKLKPKLYPSGVSLVPQNFQIRGK